MILDHVLVDDVRCGEDIAQHAGATYNPKRDHNFCRVRDDGEARLLVGGVIFTQYTGESMQLHMASWAPRWLTRDLLFMSLYYPFGQLRVKRLFGMVPEDNLRAQIFNQKLGFKTVARIEGMFRHNIACIVMCMERADCRLIDIEPRRFADDVLH